MSLQLVILKPWGVLQKYQCGKASACPASTQLIIGLTNETKAFVVVIDNTTTLLVPTSQHICLKSTTPCIW